MEVGKSLQGTFAISTGTLFFRYQTGQSQNQPLSYMNAKIKKKT